MIFSAARRGTSAVSPIETGICCGSRPVKPHRGSSQVEACRQGRHEGHFVGSTAKQIRLVTYSSLYPNAIRPTHGVFVENRLRQLVASGQAVSRVVAPVPYFPFHSPRFGDYADFARVPMWEERHGLTLHHPRYPLIPKAGMNLSPLMMALATGHAVKSAMEAEGGADILDAHYLYPDGVAATLIGRRLGLPVVITARGNDVTLIPKYPVPRKLIRKACARAAA